MAGIFGFFDYSKPGKGVRKDEPQKPRFLFFWELFFRKFWRLIQLNLLYVAFCLPIVTVGPATAGLTYVLRNMSNEQPVFLVSDFWDAFKGNLKQSFAYSVLLVLAGILLSVSWRFYLRNASDNIWMYAALAVCMMIALLMVFMSFYVFLMIVTLDLPLHAILKNAVILSVVCVKTNFLTLLFVGMLVVAALIYPVIGFLLAILIIPAWIGFIVCFNSYKEIKKYVIDPYLKSREQGDAPESSGGKLFSDDLHVHGE